METTDLEAQVQALQTKIQQGIQLTREEWLWLVAAALSLAETRQDQGYRPASTPAT